MLPIVLLIILVFHTEFHIENTHFVSCYTYKLSRVHFLHIYGRSENSSSNFISLPRHLVYYHFHVHILPLVPLSSLRSRGVSVRQRASPVYTEWTIKLTPSQTEPNRFGLSARESSCHDGSRRIIGPQQRPTAIIVVTSLLQWLLEYLIDSTA
jgi:hypothetical protein